MIFLSVFGFPLTVVRDAERDDPAAVAQPDDRATGPSVDGRVEDALAGHLEQRPGTAAASGTGAPVTSTLTSS